MQLVTVDVHWADLMSKTVNANKIITCNPLIFNMMYTWRWPLNVIIIIFPIILPKQGKQNLNLVQSVTLVNFLDKQITKYIPMGNLVKVNRCLKKVAEGWFPRQRRCTRGLLTTTCTRRGEVYNWAQTSNKPRNTGSMNAVSLARSEEGDRPDAEQILIYQRQFWPEKEESKICQNNKSIE